MVKLIIISTILLCILFPTFSWLGMHFKRKKTKKIWHDDKYCYIDREDSEGIKFVFCGEGGRRFFVKPNLMPTGKSTER